MSSLESLNQQLFLQLNAPSTVMTATAELASFIADYVLYLIPLFLVVYWIMGDTAKKQIALKSVAVALLALGIAQVIGMIYPHPRPFMIGIGHMLIRHIADPSFPSDHVTLFSAIGMAFLRAKKYVIASIVLSLGLLIGWSRVYLGVHFPFDILGAIMLSSIVAMMVEPIWQKVGASIAKPVIQLYHLILSHIFSKSLRLP